MSKIEKEPSLDSKDKLKKRPGTTNAATQNDGAGQASSRPVPEAHVRLGRPEPRPPVFTQPLPVVPGSGHRTRHEVRPVKVRVGTEISGGPGYQVNGNGSKNGNGHANGHSNGNGNGLTVAASLADSALLQGNSGNGYGNGNGAIGERMARVAAGTGPLSSNGDGDGNGSHPNTTSRLRDTDLHTLRLRLKTGEWTYPGTERSRRSRQRGALPYFLMRHRQMRARTGVGHTRTGAATKRFGKGSGAIRIVVSLFLAFNLIWMLLVAGGVGGTIAAGAYYVSKLPPTDPNHLQADISKNGITVQTTQIYDRNGTPLYDLVDEDTGRREELTLDQISPLVISATVATEDASFFTNAGVDPVGIVRAVRINVSGDGSSGASTITQQVVRQVVLSEQERQEKSFTRKIKEAALALLLTRQNSKEDILTIYLNQNFYGHRAYGIGAASFVYFGKEAKDLTLAQASLLAGLPQAPSEYDPFVHPDQAKKRQAIVLDLMAKQHMITQEEADAAKAETIVLRPYKPTIKAPHFVYYVKDYLEKKYGPDVVDSGLKVYTTLDLNVQNSAEQVAKDRIAELQQQLATNAAIVIMRPNTGEILAMVGSVDYNDQSIDGQVNVATAERQPGSSFKPITYVTAFEKGWTPGTVLLDTLTAFPNPGQKPYTPHNYDGKDHGWVTVREALGNSFNIPAVKALQFAGVQNVIDTAHSMGIKGLNRGTDWYGLSLTLGGGEVTLLDMTNAYSTFANSGTEVDADPILRIEDPQGRVLYCNSAYITPDGKCSSTQVKSMANGNQVIDPRLSYMITDVLSDNKARAMEFGTNSPLHMNFPAAAKTGTTDDNRDSWTLGYTPDLTIGVWVGNSNNAQMRAVTGAIGAAVIWHNMMQTFYDNPKFVDLIRDPDGNLQRDFVQPPGLVRRWVCSAKGDVNDLFLADALPKGCTTYKDKNQQLHSLPSAPSYTPAPRTKPQPSVPPTPMPGIIFPSQP